MKEKEERGMGERDHPVNPTTIFKTTNAKKTGIKRFQKESSNATTCQLRQHIPLSHFTHTKVS